MKFTSTRFSLKHLMLTILISSFIFTAPLEIYSQRSVEITPFAGYMLAGKVKYVEGDLNFKSNVNFGIAIGVEIATGQMIELNYTRLETIAEFKAFGIGYTDRNFKTNINYIQIGTIKELSQEQVRPFGLFSLGAAWLNSEEASISDVWRFAITLGGGAKIFFSEKVGIRLQGRLMMPMNFAGVGAYCGIGGGGSSCGLSLNSWVPLLQGDFTGGLIIKVGG